MWGRSSAAPRDEAHAFDSGTRSLHISTGKGITSPSSWSWTVGAGVNGCSGQRCVHTGATIGMTRSKDLRQIRQAVGDLVGVFIKDYLAMNH